MFKDIQAKHCIVAVLSSAFLAFGLYHVHSLSGVTEGGVIGLNLLLYHWFHISPSITNFIANVICYALGWKLLGRKFILYSAVATVSFSVSYWVFAQFDPLWPQLADAPLLSSLIGAVFVGIGAGLCVRVGGAVSGDDALAMCISHVTKIKIQNIYLISDIVVLALSATYIPINRLIFSFITVIISGQIIGVMQPKNIKKTNKNSSAG